MVCQGRHGEIDPLLLLSLAQGLVSAGDLARARPVARKIDSPEARALLTIATASQRLEDFEDIAPAAVDREPRADSDPSTRSTVAYDLVRHSQFRAARTVADFVTDTDIRTMLRLSIAEASGDPEDVEAAIAEVRQAEERADYPYLV